MDRIAAFLASSVLAFAAAADASFNDLKPARRTARAAFDAGVAEMRAQIDGFDYMPVAERGYLFNLVKKAVC
jgi:hypothetical protein